MGLAEDIKKKKRQASPAMVTVGDIQKVTSLADRIKLKQAAGLISKPEKTVEQPQQEGFLKSMGKAIIKPFAELGTAAINEATAIKRFAQGNYAGAEQALNQERGGYKPAFTGQEKAGEMTKKVLGYGLEVGSFLPIGGAVKGAGLAIKGVKAGEKLLPKIGKAALRGTREGAIGGGMVGAAVPLQENQGFGEVLKGATVGALGGAAFGGVLGGVSPIVGAGLKKIAPKTLFPKTAALREGKAMEGIISKREEEIFNIENNYAKTRKAMGYSKDANSASRKRIASTDVLVGAVDQDGLIRTENAVKQYRAMTLDGTEGVVRKNLEREGGSVSADVVKKQLVDNIMNSGLEGKALQRALNGVDNELSGLMLRADSSGRIPLAILQDAKISTYGGINFQSEPWIKTEQKALANGYKKLIEGNSNVRITVDGKTYTIKDVNEELGKYLKDIELLENLNGRRVKGGKLGKYFSQISGNIIGGIAGHAIGGPAGSAVGTVLGGELGGRLRGNILSRTLGKATGNLAPESQILKEAAKTAESPRLMLPAPKSIFRSQMPSGPTINLPSRTQSAIDEAYSKSLGNRNIQYNPTATTTNKVNIKKEVKPRLKTNIAKEKVSKEISPLIQEAKKYKSAEDFVKAQPALYHGTPFKENLSEIQKGKMVKGQEGNLGDAIYLTSNKDTANFYAKKTGGVAEINISPKAKIEELDMTDLDNYFVKKYPEDYQSGWTNEVEGYSMGEQIKQYADEKGLDGIKFEEDIAIYNPKIIQTKSQLTDIWNKANKTNTRFSTNKKPTIINPDTLKKEANDFNPKITSIDKFEKAPQLSPINREIETKAFNRILKNEDTIIKDYISKNGNVVNNDSLKKYFKDDGYNGQNAVAVQEPSSYLQKRVRSILLQNEGEYGIVYSGGSGTGKTSAIKNIPKISIMKNKAAMILDGNLSSFKSADKVIQEIIAAGKKPVIPFVYREPLDAFENGIVKRQKRNIEEMGRVVPNKVTADNTIGSWDTLKKVSEKYPGIEVYYIDNSLGANKAKLVSLSSMLKKIKYPTKEEYIKMLNKRTKELYGKRTINLSDYKAYIE